MITSKFRMTNKKLLSKRNIRANLKKTVGGEWGGRFLRIAAAT
jgi:hypothetical protein